MKSCTNHECGWNEERERASYCARCGQEFNSSLTGSNSDGKQGTLSRFGEWFFKERGKTLDYYLTRLYRDSLEKQAYKLSVLAEGEGAVPIYGPLRFRGRRIDHKKIDQQCNRSAYFVRRIEELDLDDRVNRRLPIVSWSSVQKNRKILEVLAYLALSFGSIKGLGYLHDNFLVSPSESGGTVSVDDSQNNSDLGKRNLNNGAF